MNQPAILIPSHLRVRHCEMLRGLIGMYLPPKHSILFETMELKIASVSVKRLLINIAELTTDCLGVSVKRLSINIAELTTDCLGQSPPSLPVLAVC